MQYPSERCEICKHYTGGKVFNEISTKDEFVEGEFLPTCKAFPNGIPEVINSGKNNHTNKIEWQDNNIVFEKLNKEDYEQGTGK